MKVFSTPKPWKGLINVIQRNAIRSWLRQTEPADICLYGDDYGTKEACAEFGLEHRSCKLTSYGTPNIGWIFRDMGSEEDVKAYINADIIMSNDGAFRAITAHQPPFTATAARMGFSITDEIINWEYLYEALKLFLSTATPRCGVDIFIFTYLPPMPDFALGRGSWDKWFVATARESPFPFYDLSKDFWTIHQTHNYDHLGVPYTWDGDGFNWKSPQGKGPETKSNAALYKESGLPDRLEQPFIKNCQRTLTYKAMTEWSLQQFRSARCPAYILPEESYIRLPNGWHRESVLSTQCTLVLGPHAYVCKGMLAKHCESCSPIIAPRKYGTVLGETYPLLYDDHVPQSYFFGSNLQAASHYIEQHSVTE